MCYKVLSKICKELQNNRKQTPQYKMVKDLHIHFSKKTNKHIIKHPTSLATREKQIKSIMKYFILIVMVKKKTSDSDICKEIYISNAFLIVVQSY